MLALFERDVAALHSATARATFTAIAVADALRRAVYERWSGTAAPAALPEALPEALPALAAQSPLAPVQTRTLIRQLAVPFGVAYALATITMVALYVQRVWSDAALFEQAALSLPYTSALTIPLALCLAVSWVSRRLCRESGAGFMPPGLQRSVLIVSSVVAAFMLLLGAEVVPRANQRLVDIRSGHAVARSDRAMTLGELQRAANTMQARAMDAVDVHTERMLLVQAANYRVEFHKKFVLAFACIVLAFAGLALGWRFARAPAVVVLASSIGVFMALVVSVMAGESLADSLAGSPMLAMWAGTELMAVAVLFHAATQSAASKRPA